MKKTLLSLILVAFSLSLSAVELEQIEEMPNINKTTDWMKNKTKKLTKGELYKIKIENENKQAEQEAADLCMHATNEAMRLCEQSLIMYKTGISAVKPVKLMIQAAAAEKNNDIRTKLMEAASLIARRRMNQQAFEKLIDEVIS